MISITYNSQTFHLYIESIWHISSNSEILITLVDNNNVKYCSYNDEIIISTNKRFKYKEYTNYPLYKLIKALIKDNLYEITFNDVTNEYKLIFNNQYIQYIFILEKDCNLDDIIREFNDIKCELTKLKHNNDNIQHEINNIECKINDDKNYINNLHNSINVIKTNVNNIENIINYTDNHDYIDIHNYSNY